VITHIAAACPRIIPHARRRATPTAQPMQLGSTVKGRVRQGDAIAAVQLRRAQEGNREGLEAFFAHHLPALRRWAHQRVPRWLYARADPDDIVQLAMIRTLRRLHHLDPARHETVQPYLRQIVLNLICDEIRKAGREPVSVALEEDIAAVILDPADRIYGRQSWNAYRKALASLTPRARECVIARVERGLDYDAIAKRTGRRSPGAARVAVTRALESLSCEMRRHLRTA